MQHFRMLFSACIVALLFNAKASAQNTEIAEAAREPFNRGMAAVKIQDWELARQYFLEARKKDNSPQILFNLGLMSTRMAGHELRAIAWFKAYLAAAPNAANAPAVREQITALEIKLESVIGKLVSEMAALLPVIMATYEKRCGDRYDLDCWSQQNDVVYVKAPRLLTLSFMQALLGRTAAARDTLSSYKFEDTFREASKRPSSEWGKLARAFADAGDLETAKNLLQNRIKEPDVIESVNQAITGRLLHDGRVHDASNAAGGMHSALVPANSSNYLSFAETREYLVGPYFPVLYYAGSRYLLETDLKALRLPAESYDDTQMQKLFGDLAQTKGPPDLVYAVGLSYLEKFLTIWKYQLR